MIERIGVTICGKYEIKGNGSSARRVLGRNPESGIAAGLLDRWTVPEQQPKDHYRLCAEIWELCEFQKGDIQRSV